MSTALGDGGNVTTFSSTAPTTLQVDTTTINTTTDSATPVATPAPTSMTTPTEVIITPTNYTTTPTDVMTNSTTNSVSSVVSTINVTGTPTVIDPSTPVGSGRPTTMTSDDTTGLRKKYYFILKMQINTSFYSFY